MDNHLKYNDPLELLPGFLREAERRRYIPDVEQWLTVSRIWPLAGKDLQKLKYTLSAVLAQTPEQQAAFYLFFDEWFNIEKGLHVQPPDDILKELEVGESAKSKVRNRDFIYIMGAAILAIIIIGLWYYMRFDWFSLVVVLSGVGFIVTGRLARKFFEDETSESIGSNKIVLIIAIITGGFGYYMRFDWFSLIVVLSSMGLYIATDKWLTRKFSRKKIEVAAGGTTTEPSEEGQYWDVHLPSQKQINFGAEAFRLSLRLRERLPGSRLKFDAVRTALKASRQKGFITLEYSPVPETPQTLFLIDASNRNNHRSALFDALHQYLKSIDTPVARFYFFGKPNLLWNENYPQGVRLDALVEIYQGAHLFVLGDGWQMLDPYTGKISKEFKGAFEHWKSRVLLTPISFHEWTTHEKNMERVFEVAPFNAEGLKAIAGRLARHINFNQFDQQSPQWKDVQPVVFDEDALPDSLWEHFPEPYMRRWLAALSLFPVLNWNLTLFLGAFISKKEGRNILNFENLRRLNLVYWFFNGFIPENSKKILYKTLDSRTRTEIHGEILEFLEQQRKHKEDFWSTEKNSMRLQFLMHKVYGGKATKKEYKELFSLAGEVEDGDFLIAGITKTPRYWAWKLSDRFMFLVNGQNKSIESKILGKVDESLPPKIEKGVIKINLDIKSRGRILGRINTFDIEELVNNILREEITLEEMVSAGLSPQKRMAIRDMLIEKGYELLAIDQIEKELERLRDLHLERILQKNNYYDELFIRQLLDDGYIYETDLKKIGFTPNDIEKINNIKDHTTLFDDWADLPVLPTGRTDVYVFGIVGSGKSSLLGGILYQAKTRAILMPDARNNVGQRYRHDLTNRISLGILPQSTHKDFINYISISLYDEKELPHPLSIIEMSGEKFTQTYETGNISSNRSIGSRQYLKNDNRKIIIFVIDYLHFISGEDQHSIAPQSDQIESVLSMLSEDGTLDKTDAVLIVVTKTDLMPNKTDVKTATMEFLETSEYGMILSHCRRLKKKHNFRIIIHPFSLGRFILPKSYNFDPVYSNNILDDIINFSFGTTRFARKTL